MNHANFAQTTLGAAITTTDGTSITVTSEAGFPSVPFIIAIDTEVMLVTNVATTTWTVTRGYESSTAATHLNGATIYHDWSAGEANSAVLGPASATDAHLAVFDGTTGKLLKDGGACTAAGLALIDDANAAAQLTTLGALPLAGGTMTGNLIMDNMDVTLVKLLTLHGEIDDGNSSTADTIDWNAGAAHKSTLTGNVTFAFTGHGTDIVPTMTSNTAPSGVASASSENLALAYKAFNDSATHTWQESWSSDSTSYPITLQYQFTEAKTILEYSIQAANYATHMPTAWTLQGSNNGADWTTIDTVAVSGLTQDSKAYYTVDTPGPYAYYRLSITAVSGNNGPEIAEWELMDTATLNPPAPCFLTLKLVQDGTGGRTVTWPATVKGTPSINLAANATSNVLFYWDGTNYWVINGKQFASATDKVIGRSTAGAGELEEIACTAAGRALLDDATAADQLTTLGALPLAGGTMSGNITLGENTAVALDPAGSADEKWSGITVTGTAGAALAVGDLCYLNSSWKWVLTDADTAAAAGQVALGLCILAAAGDTSATNMLLLGTMRSAAFPASITGGAQLYVSQTAGDMTTTMPTGADVVARVVGWAISTEPNTIYFCPSADFITRTA